MKYLNKYVLFESDSNWWVPLIDKHNFDVDYVSEILGELKEFEIRFRISKLFCDINFNEVKKIQDTINKDYYCTYQVKIEDPNHINTKDFIDKRNAINHVISRLDNEFKIRIQKFGTILLIDCIDTSLLINRSLINYKKDIPVTASTKIRPNIDSILEELEKHQKILTATKEYDQGNKQYYIKVLPVGIDGGKLAEILHKMLRNPISAGFISISTMNHGEWSYEEGEEYWNPLPALKIQLL